MSVFRSDEARGDKASNGFLVDDCYRCFSTGCATNKALVTAFCWDLKRLARILPQQIGPDVHVALSLRYKSGFSLLGFHHATQSRDSGLRGR